METAVGELTNKDELETSKEDQEPSTAKIRHPYVPVLFLLAVTAGQR